MINTITNTLMHLSIEYATDSWEIARSVVDLFRRNCTDVYAHPLILDSRFPHERKFHEAHAWTHNDDSLAIFRQRKLFIFKVAYYNGEIGLLS